MLEHFTLRLNLEHLDRFAIPMKSDKAGRKALIAECAFSVMAEKLKPQGELITLVKIHEKALIQTLVFLAICLRLIEVPLAF